MIMGSKRKLMNKRIILAGLFGGIAMFIWTSIAHMLPLGEAGIREMPNEATTMAALQSSLGNNRGLYIFPGPGLGPNPTREARSEAMKHMSEKIAHNPSGIFMYHPAGRTLNLASLLGTEFATELLESFLVIYLLAQTRLNTFGGRLGFVIVAGIVAALATNVSYWNWYGFPARYTAAYMFSQIVGFFIVGLIAALAFRNTRAATDR